MRLPPGVIWNTLPKKLPPEAHKNLSCRKIAVRPEWRTAKGRPTLAFIAGKAEDHGKYSRGMTWNTVPRLIQ